MRIGSHHSEDAKARISIGRKLTWDRAKRKPTSRYSQRYVIVQVTGYPMDKPEQKRPSTEFRIIDDLTGRAVAIFESKQRDARKHCNHLNREEWKWERENALI